MSKLDARTLHALEKLCKISCEPDEEADILQSLSRILEYIAQLDTIPTEGVKPCTYVLDGMLKNALREDEVREVIPREQFLANAPDQIGGMIRVPSVLK